MHNLKITAITSLGEYSGTIVEEPMPDLNDLENLRARIQTSAPPYLVLYSVTAAGAPQQIRLSETILENSVLLFELISS